MSDDQLLRLQAEARQVRERFQLYKARTYGPKPTDPARLRELECTCQRADARLRRARTMPSNN